MLLSKCPRGARARLTRIDVDPCHFLRLQELGLREGARFSVATRAAFGGVVINVAGTRVAVDRRSAAHIEVEPEVAAVPEIAAVSRVTAVPEVATGSQVAAGSQVGVLGATGLDAPADGRGRTRAPVSGTAA